MTGKRISTERKKRCDAKKEIAPTVPQEIYDAIAQLSYICEQPLKTIGESIVEAGLNDKSIMYDLSKLFRRDLTVGNTIYIGDITRKNYKRIFSEDEARMRLSMRFKAFSWDRIDTIGYCLGCRPATACGLLLEESLKARKLVLRIITRFANEDMDHRRRKQLKHFLDELNNDTPYEERLSLTAIVNAIAEEAMNGARTIKSVIETYVGR